MSEHKCEFVTETDNLFFVTKVNSDKAVLSSLVLTQEQATNMTYLAKSGSRTKLRIIVDLDE